MTFQEFYNSLSQSEPPASISLHLSALWYDGKGDWDKSHKIIQDLNDGSACWIHAYLHRKEGDIGNADYWYSRAGRIRPHLTLEEEWTSIVESLINL